MTYFLLYNFNILKSKMKQSGVIGNSKLKDNEDHGNYPSCIDLLAQNCRDFLKEFETLKTAKDANLKTLEKQKEMVLHSVTDMKDRLVRYLDKLEEDAIEITNKLYDTEINELTKQMESLDEMTSKVKSQEEELEKYIEKGFSGIEYWQRTYFESGFEEYRRTLMDIHKNSFNISSTYEPNTDITKCVHKLKTFGKINMMKSKSGCVLPTMSVCPLTDRTAFISGETNTKFPADLDIPSINEMHVMDNGNTLVCDDNNQKIKLFDKEKKPLSALWLTSVPHGFALLNQNKAMITLPMDKQINIVKIGEELTLAKKVNTKLMCGPITQYKSNVIVFAEGTKHNYLNIIDRQGNKLKCIRREKRSVDNTGLFQKITCIAVSSDSETVYLTDLHNGCIGLSMKGKIMFRFTDSQILGYSGVCITGEDDIFITGKESNNVILVKKNTKLAKEIVGSNLIRPSFVSYCQKRNQLLVTQAMSDTVKSFNLL